MKAMFGFSRSRISKASFFGFCMIFYAFFSCGKNGASYGTNNSNIVNYTGVFVNSGVPDSSKATGTVMATFNTSTLVLSYTFSWKSLTSQPVQMHFHDDGPVIVKILGFPVSTSGTITGNTTFTSAQGSDLARGYIYAMIHTVNYTAGEIMATLVKQ